MIPLEQVYEHLRKEARENGWVLHEESYRNGREWYVLPKYQNVSYEKIRAAQRNDGTLNCYQR